MNQIHDKRAAVAMVRSGKEVRGEGREVVTGEQSGISRRS